MEAVLGILFMAAGVGLDRVVKIWAERVLAPVGSIPVWDGVFRLTYAENRGAAFSLFHGQRWFLVAVTGAVLAVLLVAIVKNWIPKGLARWGAYCVASGAVGNFIDRIARGYVIDLFDFYLINFAIFNVADILVCVGGGLFALWVIIGMIREKREGEKKA
ncbi:MAG: signal peptidase II [Eubacteriales bacterium]|nr:signal peptidase II [Eubacteriales bacterium]